MAIRYPQTIPFHIELLVHNLIQATYALLCQKQNWNFPDNYFMIYRKTSTVVRLNLLKVGS
jgi:hypothetical protein